MPESPDPVAHLLDISDAVIAVDETWRITHVNVAAEDRALALSGRRARGQLLWDVYEQRLSPLVRTALERAMRDRTVVTAEQLLPRSGPPFEVTAHPIESGLILISRDVSARSRRALGDQLYRDVEDVLASALSWREALHALVRLLCERAEWPFAEVWLEQRGGSFPRVIDVAFDDDDAGAAAFASATHAVIGNSPGALVPRAIAHEAPLRLNALLDEDFPRAAPARAARFRASLHAAIPLEGGVYVVLGVFSRRDGALDLWMDVLEDVWPALRALFATRLAQVELTRFFELSAECLAVFGFDGQIQRVNQAFCHALGYSRDELLGRPFERFVHPDDRSRVQAELTSIAEGQSTFRFESRWRHRDGSYRVFEWSTSPSLDEQRLYAVARDVTAERMQSDDLRQLAARLTESEERFRIAARLTRAVIWDWDLRTNQVAWSDEYEAVSGHRRDEIPADATRLAALVHADDRASFDRAVRDAIDGSTDALELEFRALHASGEWHIVHAKGVVQRDASGTPLRLVGVMMDVTDERAREHALAENELRYRVLARSTSDAVGDWDLRDGTIRWNDGASSLLGSGDDGPPRTRSQFAMLLDPEDRARFLERLEETLAGPEDGFTHEVRVRAPDGSLRTIVWRAEVIRDPRGAPVRLIAGLKDVSERRASERRLGEQATLLDSATDAIHVRTLDGVLLYANRAARALYGIDGDAAGLLLSSRLAVTGTARDRAEAELRARGDWSGELPMEMRDARRLTIHARWTRIEGDDEHPVRILAIESDVTERKRLESQFLRAQRLESIGTLAGGIAHDLNNVLAPILLSIELLGATAADEESRALLATLEGSARRGADMVRQVLSFARGVSGERAAIAPGDIVADVERIAREVLPRNLQLHTHVAPDTWPVVGDPTHLHQVLLNLVVNARDAMVAGGTLRIAVENATVDTQYAAMHAGARAGQFVRLSVADTGMGMPEEVRLRIFEPFFTTKPFGQGTGLGLSTVLTIVKAHGGFVQVYSEPARGSEFRIHLPAALGRAGEYRASEPLGELPRGEGEIILVIDDEAAIRAITRQTLEAYGYRVLTAADGAEGIALFARRHDIAAVVTDMMMPVMDGEATIRALRELDPEVRVVATSGLGANVSPAAVAALHVRHLLPKPFSAHALLRVLRDVLSGGSA